MLTVNGDVVELFSSMLKSPSFSFDFSTGSFRKSVGRQISTGSGLQLDFDAHLSRFRFRRRFQGEDRGRII